MPTRRNNKRFIIRGKKILLDYSGLPARIYLTDIVKIALVHYNSVFGCRFHYFFKTAPSKGDNTQILHVYLSFDSVKTIYSAKKLDITLNGQSYPGVYRPVRGQPAKGCHDKIVKGIIKLNPFNGEIKTNIISLEYDDRWYQRQKKALKHLAKVYIKHDFVEAMDVLEELYPDLVAEWGNNHNFWWREFFSHFQDV